METAKILDGMMIEKLTASQPDSGWIELDDELTTHVQVQLARGAAYKILVSLLEPQEDFAPSVLVDESQTPGLYELKAFQYVRFLLVGGEKALVSLKEGA